MLTRPLSALLLLLATPTAADIFAAVGNDSPLEIQNALECVPSTTRQPPTHAQLTLTLCPHRRAGAALNGKGPGGQTPLMNAVLMGKLDAVEALLSAGADVTIPEKDGYTPMHGAGFQGRAEIAKALIKHGVDPSDMHCALAAARFLRLTRPPAPSHHLYRRRSPFSARAFVLCSGRLHADSPRVLGRREAAHRHGEGVPRGRRAAQPARQERADAAADGQGQQGDDRAAQGLGAEGQGAVMSVRL